MKLKFVIFFLLGSIVIASLFLVLNPAPTSKTPVALPINAAGQAPAFNEPPINVTVTPTPPFAKGGAATTPQTGAIIVPTAVFDKAAYDELYKLLGSAKITTDAFTIQPNLQTRLIVITINPPADINIQKAFDWLRKNGYGDIPPKNLRFIEL